ncbi:MAG: DUF1189 family protein [Bacilli bacterium]|jgi:hypothetical protein
MFKRLRDALFSPSNLAEYRKDRWWITALFFIMLVVVASLPSILYYLTPQKLTEDDTLMIRQDFEGLNIPYKIVDGNLIQASSSSLDAVNVLVAESYMIVITTNDNYELSTDYPVFMIGKTKVTKITKNNTQVILEYREYPELNNLNFTKLTTDNYMEWDAVYSVINQELESNSDFVAFVGILEQFLVTVVTYLVLSLLLVLVNRMNFSNIDFKSGWKLLIYCFAPYAFGELFAGLYGIGILSFVGILLTVFFSTRVLRKIYLEKR